MPPNLDRSLKSQDIVAFNQSAEAYFIFWLSKYLKKKKSVTVTWVLQNASFELDLSPETIKRYLLKHTAEKADFKQESGVVTLK